jgi:nucleotide-binding universal stress UspA family protein
VLIGRDLSSLDEPVHGAEPPVVLVGLDAGKDCARVLRVAADEAAVRGARLVAVHALNTAPAHTKVALAVGWRRVHDAMRSAGLPVGVPSRLVITRDDPVTALLLRARPQDLLVVGTRGGGRLAGLVQGSVSRAVLDSMPCDVLVVPQPRPGQPGNQSAPGDLALAGTDAAQRS